jgi:hypothetical protein
LDERFLRSRRPDEPVLPVEEGTLRRRSAPGITVALLALATFAAMIRPAHADGTVTLTWTAPGDDSLMGTATAYDLRYSTTLINAANFSSASRVSPEPVPLASGRQQTDTVHGLTPGTYYYFAIRTVDDAGNWSALSNVPQVLAAYNLAVGDAPIELAFSTPYPNPARALASFALALPSASETSIEAFDAAGRRVRTLASGVLAAGRQTIAWDLRDDAGRQLGSGLYLVRARIGTQVFIRRVMVTR